MSCGNNIIINLVFKLGLLIILVAACWGLLTNVVIPMVHEAKVTDGIYAGEVVDKDIVNPRSGIFTSRDMYYRVTIRSEYEYNGETKYATKHIAVDKETYVLLDIGDWFNSQTLEIVDAEGPKSEHD